MAKVPDRYETPDLVPGRRSCEVASTAASSISYSDAKKELYVTWTGGGTYTYYGVSPNVYQALCAAPSKGKFLNRVIKGGAAQKRIGGVANYRYSRGG